MKKIISIICLAVLSLASSIAQDLNVSDLHYSGILFNGVRTHTVSYQGDINNWQSVSLTWKLQDSETSASVALFLTGDPTIDSSVLMKPMFIQEVIDGKMYVKVSPFYTGSVTLYEEIADVSAGDFFKYEVDFSDKSNFIVNLYLNDTIVYTDTAAYDENFAPLFIYGGPNKARDTEHPKAELIGMAVTQIPEPSAYAISLGALAIAFAAYRRKKQL